MKDRSICGMSESWLVFPSTAGHMIKISPSELPFPLQLLTLTAVRQPFERETVWTGQLVGRADKARKAWRFRIYASHGLW